MRNKNKLKIKGRYLYFCEDRPTLYSEPIIIRKVYIRMATFTNDNMVLIVGDNFREEIPAQNANDDEFLFLTTCDDGRKILTTNKQNIARFLRKRYLYTQTHGFILHHKIDAYSSSTLYRKYLIKLKRL